MERNFSRLPDFALALTIAASLACCGGAAAAGSGSPGTVPSCLSEPPSRYFPGKYFEQKAQCSLKKGDYPEALRMFELGGLYADKLSQYNIGIMHFNGIGVPVDRPRGAAWLGIAAESHDDLADAALQAAYAELDADERVLADALFRELDARYGDAVALPRALAQYRLDTADSMFKLGSSGPGSVTTVGYGSENSADFVRRMDAQRDALVAQIKGHVTVGSVQALGVAPDARGNASDKVLEVDTDEHH
jgi:TPR repeat protein